jgi:hypothetical protein
MEWESVQQGLNQLSGLGSAAALIHDGLDTSHLTTEDVKAGRVFELADLLLNTEVQHFLAQFAAASTELFDGHLTELFSQHGVSKIELVGDGAGHKASAKTQFVGSEAAGFTCDGFSHARHFKKHVTWKNHSYPEFR